MVKAIEPCVKHKGVDLIGGFKLCIVCGTCKKQKAARKPPLRPIHHWLLQDIREQFPQHFMQDRTEYFYSDMWRYIYEKRVFRISIMGETRSGKSEIGQTVALNYIIVFNALYKEGHFKNLIIDKEVKIGELEFAIENVHANESAYLYYLRDKTKEKGLIFGQIHEIDESRDNVGGIGSFSEEMEINNMNNIVAKFCQCEIWITPRRFLEMNTPYGANCYIKDEEFRENWLLFYKLEMQSDGLKNQNFLGWLCIGLHDDVKLRKDYAAKKDEWIKRELAGTINERAQRRRLAVEFLVQDEEFTRHTLNKSGEVRFSHGIEEMKFLVEKAMLDHKIDQFNDTEIERIVAGVRAMKEATLRGANDTNQGSSESISESTNERETQVRSRGDDDTGKGRRPKGAVPVRHQRPRSVSKKALAK